LRAKFEARSLTTTRQVWPNKSLTKDDQGEPCGIREAPH